MSNHEQLKPEIKLTESKAQTGEPSSEMSSQALSEASSQVSLSSESDVNHTAVQTIDPQREKHLNQSAAQVNDAEQAFLVAHKKRRIQSTIRVVIAAISLTLVFALALGLGLFANRQSGSACFGALPILSLAIIGERDQLYGQMSEWPTPSSEDSQRLLSQRARILENLISDLERDGRPALFSHLAAQSLLIRGGERMQGLKQSDFLIAEHPGLPSNYVSRAQAEFDALDFSHAIEDYDRCAVLLRNSSPQLRESTVDELLKGAWASLDSGQLNKAQHFVDLFQNLGGYQAQAVSFRAGIFLWAYDALDINELKHTELWNQHVSDYALALLNKARSQADSIQVSHDENRFYDPASAYKDNVLTEIAMKKGDHLYVEQQLVRASRYKRPILAAQFALTKSDPNAALAASAKVYDQDQSAYAAVLRASALEKAHMPDQALAITSVGLGFYPNPGTETGSHYLPLLTLKARALFELGKYDEALKTCDQVISLNPILIEPRLIKLSILKQLKKVDQVAQEQIEISHQLERLIDQGQ